MRDNWELVIHAEANPPYQNLYFYKISGESYTHCGLRNTPEDNGSH